MSFSNYSSDSNGYFLEHIDNLADWYVIDFQPGTNGDKGTVTLLAERPLELVPYDENMSPEYVGTSIKRYLDGYTAAEPTELNSFNPLWQFADAIIDTDTNGDNTADSKLYILSNTDIYYMGTLYPSINEFLKFEQSLDGSDFALTDGYNDYYEYVWWLRNTQPSGFTYFDSKQGDFANPMHDFPVRDENGTTIFENRQITAGDKLGLRPAMKLDLNKVSYNYNLGDHDSGVFYIVPVTAAHLDKTAEQTVTVGDKVAFNAYLEGCDLGFGMEAPSDKNVTWSVVGANTGSVKLYYDANCTNLVGTESVPFNVPVYAKGAAVGSAKVRVTSSADSTKYAECPVKVKSATRSVTLNGGANATPSPATGVSQTGLTGEMATVTFTAERGYHFEDFSDITTNGVKTTKTSDTVVTVSGTPTDDATVTVPDAVAITPYAPYLMNAETPVKLDGIDWYVIKDESTAADEGTITLLAKDAVGSSYFNPRGGNNVYKGSAIAKYLDDLLETGALINIYDVVVPTDLADVGVTDARLFLLSAEEANALDSSIRFCSWGTGGWSNIWFTRSPGNTGNGSAMCVSASQKASNTDVGNVCGVRPAFQLDLTMVNFNSETREFTFKPNDSGHYVMILGGDFATASPSNGALQTSLTGAMTTVTYTAKQNYTFEPFDDIVKNGITVKRISDTQITVSGTPTSNVRIKIPDPVTAFSAYVNDNTRTVRFSGIEWYVIADNSLVPGDGTVTLLAKYPIASDKFNQRANTNKYSASSIKKYLDGLTLSIEAPTLKTYGQTGDGISAEAKVVTGAFTSAANVIAPTDLADVGVTDARLYLLSVSEAMALDVNIRKCTKANGSASTFWFLRTPNPLQGQMAKVVVSGTGNEFVQYVNSTNEIRPALRLDISKVAFNSETNTFELSGGEPEVEVAYYSAAKSGDTYTKNGNALSAAPAGAGDYVAEATLTIGDYTETASVGYTIAKAVPVCNPPAGLTATVGDTLGDISLAGKNPEGNTPGVWRWYLNNNTIIKNGGANKFYAVFVPDDTANYATNRLKEVTINVSRLDPTANAPTGVSAAYGDTLADVTLTNPEGNTPGSWTWADDTTDVGSVGSHKFKASFTPTEAEIYNTVNDVDVTVVVNKAAGSISYGIGTVNKTYGDAAFTNTLTVTGDETVTYATSNEAVVTVAENGEVTIVGAGTATITATVADGANYVYTDKTAAYTVNVGKASLTVNAEANSKTYGEADPELHYTAEGLISGDAISGALTRAEGENVGTYAIQLGTLNAGNNYEISYTGASFTINKKPASVTADDKSKTYGDADPELTATVEGTVGSDTLSYTLNRAEGNNFGEYDITVTLGENPNYDITATGAKLTIGKRTLTVNAKNKTVYIGQNIPDWSADSYTVRGLVDGDTIDVSVEYWQNDAKAEELDNSKVGTYTIKPVVKANDNYEVTAVDGTLTISNYPAPAAPATYAPTIPATENGTVTLEPKAAEAGEKVTVKVTPDEGYKLSELTVKDASGKEIELTKNEDGTCSFTQPSGKVTVEAKFAKEVKFADVPENSYYADAVDWAVEKGITNGVDKTHFAPDATCTRAQAVTFLWRALGCPEPTSTKSEFTDVTDADAFYFKAVLWATENGVTLGYDDGRFGVDDVVTRAHMVTFMERAMKGKANTAESFTDVPEGAFYADAAAWAKENGISDGIGEGKFGGEIDCLRAQIVTMLYRYFVK